ncbi:MAG TPA: hypothetical protein VGG64_12410 [Pirellulales bacterium]
MMDESQRRQKLREIEEVARGWGKLLAQLAFPNGVGLDVDLWMIEEVAVTASKALVRGAVEDMTGTQAGALEGEAPCPECGRRCRLDHRPRSIQVRGGTADLDEPVAHCSTCRRDFFPSASGAED